MAQMKLKITKLALSLNKNSKTFIII
jgi:hypothetical protein